jgi:kumamolisin
MAFEQRVKLPGSDKAPLPDSHMIGNVEPEETVHVSVVLRRKGADPAVAGGRAVQEHLSHEELAAEHGADPRDLEIVEQFAHAYGLAVEESSLRKRLVTLAGTAEAMEKAFGTNLKQYRVDTTGPHFRGRVGPLSIPADLEGPVMAVLGLDTRPIAKPHFRRKKRTGPTGTFTPPEIAKLYNFPTGVNGAGQTIAIIELGGGYKANDLAKYFKDLGIKEPVISAVSVDGGKNAPGSPADGEVMLDIEVAGAIAPGANIAVYFAPNTDKGFVDAITNAVHDTARKPSVVSISWGASEDNWTQQSRDAMNAAFQDAAVLGVTVTVAAGDDGSTDGGTDRKLHVDFPAASPYALACGGTTLVGSGSNITSETVWNEIAKSEGATGGGISNLNPLPTYQKGAGVPVNPQTQYIGRGVPDIAGDADPVTGYQVLVDGQDTVVGGTSAVAPLWAALIALINQKLGKPVGFVNPALYKMSKSAFHDITSGNNDSGGLGFFSAKTGWDPCTGLGTPDGTAILNALQPSSSNEETADAVVSSR